MSISYLILTVITGSVALFYLIISQQLISKLKYRIFSLEEELHKCKIQLDEVQSDKVLELNNVYKERNILVALLAQLFPSGIKKTEIEGWSPEWHNCVYIELPDGSQCSWHYHDEDSYLFENLPIYSSEWDGHTTENKYFNIEELIASGSLKKLLSYKQLQDCESTLDHYKEQGIYSNSTELWSKTTISLNLNND